MNIKFNYFIKNIFMMKEEAEVKIQDIQDNMQIQVINILLKKLLTLKIIYI